MLNRILYGSCLIMGCVLLLTACDDKSPLGDATSKKQHSSAFEDEAPAAKTLSDVIGQISHTISSQHEIVTKSDMAKDALPFVGRYQTKIACQDKIINCEEGQSDIVLNLLPDGTAHRTIIHLGKITYASNLQYSQDKWFYDPKLHEIVVERGNGLKYFFNTQHKDQLILDASKVIAINKAFFEQGHPEPMGNYVLHKEQKDK